MTKSRSINPMEKALEILNQQANSLNITIISKINGRLNPEILPRAIALAQKRHPILNSKISLKLSQIYFLDNNNNLPFKIVKLTNIEAWKDALLHEINQKIESNKYLLRFTLIQSTNDSSINYFIITIHHAIADGLSSLNLHSEILLYYQKIADSEDTSNIKSLGILPSIIELIPNSVSKSLNIGDIKNYLQSISFLSKLKIQEILHRPKSLKVEKYVPMNSRQTGLVMKNLDAKLTQKIIDSCRREKTTVNSIVSAALLKATAKKIENSSEKQDINNISISCQNYVNLRKRIVPNIANENLSCLTSFVNTFHTINKNTSLWSLARDVKQKLENNLNKQNIFLPILMINTVARYYLSFPEKPASVVITNAGKLNIQQNYNSFTLEEISFLTSQRAFLGLIVVSVATFNQQMSLNFVFSEPSISQDTAEEFANMTIDYLNNACE